MNLRRLITAMTLIAFLPFAVGCSTTSIVTVDTDPETSSARAKLQSGEPVRISGYSRPDDGFREWDGTVEVIEGDQLSFVETPNEDPTTAAGEFVLRGDEVTALHVVQADNVATTILVLTSLLAVGAAAAGAYLAANPIDMNMGY